MQRNTLMLSAVLGGIVAGLLGGVAVKPVPRHIAASSLRSAPLPMPTLNVSYQFVDSGPEDLSPSLYSGRLPTWKRRELKIRDDAMPRHPYVVEDPFKQRWPDASDTPSFPVPSDRQEDPAPAFPDENQEAAAAILDAPSPEA